MSLWGIAPFKLLALNIIPNCQFSNLPCKQTSAFSSNSTHYESENLKGLPSQIKDLSFSNLMEIFIGIIVLRGGWIF